MTCRKPEGLWETSDLGIPCQGRHSVASQSWLLDFLAPRLQELSFQAKMSLPTWRETEEIGCQSMGYQES